jgi:hypothetical protein
MPRIWTRILAYLLVPCLVADPALAFGLNLSRSVVIGPNTRCKTSSALMNSPFNECVLALREEAFPGITRRDVVKIGFAFGVFGLLMSPQRIWAAPSDQDKFLEFIMKDLNGLPDSLRLRVRNTLVYSLNLPELKQVFHDPKAGPERVIELLGSVSGTLLKDGYYVMLAPEYVRPDNFMSRLKDRISGTTVIFLRPDVRFRAAILHINPKPERRFIGGKPANIYSVERVSGYTKATDGLLELSFTGVSDAFIFDKRIDDVVRHLGTFLNSPKDNKAWAQLKDFIIFDDSSARDIILDAFGKVPPSRLKDVLRDYFIGYALMSVWRSQLDQNPDTAKDLGAAATSSEPYLHLLRLAHWLEQAQRAGQLDSSDLFAFRGPAQWPHQSQAAVAIANALVLELTRTHVMSSGEMFFYDGFEKAEVPGQKFLGFIDFLLNDKKISKSELQQVLKNIYRRTIGDLPPEDFRAGVGPIPTGNRRQLFESLFGGLFGGRHATAFPRSFRTESLTSA